jgi:hypothetical protein
MSPCHGHFDEVRGRAVCGWAWFPEQPARPVTVVVSIDGEPIIQGLADAHRPDLEIDGIADGCKSYSLLLPIEKMDGREHEISVAAEDGTLLFGSPRVLSLTDLRFRALAPDPLSYPIELAVCCIIKNEGPYLLEWLAYHRLMGIDHFLLFDNESTDGTSEMLERLAKGGIVEHVAWPTGQSSSPQLPAYAEGLRRMRGRAKWIAYIDVDEFLHPLTDPDVKTVLRDYEDVGGLMVPWRIFGSSGENRKRDDLVLRRFTHRASDDFPLNRSVKTIARSHCVTSVGVHTPTLTEGCLTDEFRMTGGTFGHPDMHPIPEAKRLVINHYFGKSREEWEAKRLRGRATDPGMRPDSDFFSHDRNEIADLRILRFSDAVADEMKMLVSRCGD